jgi:hypothetical protein
MVYILLYNQTRKELKQGYDDIEPANKKLTNAN